MSDLPNIVFAFADMLDLHQQLTSAAAYELLPPGYRAAIEKYCPAKSSDAAAGAAVWLSLNHFENSGQKDINGEGGIRTPEAPKAPNGFQIRRFQPLSHLSSRSADGRTHAPTAHADTAYDKAAGAGHQGTAAADSPPAGRRF
jgi:hypothetical protein